MSEHQVSTQVTVTASTEIVSGTRSSPFNLATITSKIDLRKLKFPIQVGIWNKRGEISLSNNSAHLETKIYFWPKLIQFAPDCHVQNVRICRWQHDTIVIQATKTIQAGQQLYLWFGEDLLVNDLGIPPYLSPINIKGGKNYVCDKCGHEYEAPNQLKIHLSLNCGIYSIDMLWSRLASLGSINTDPGPRLLMTPQPTFPFAVVRAPYFIPPLRHHQQSSQIRSRTNHQSQRYNHSVVSATDSSTSTSTTFLQAIVPTITSSRTSSTSPSIIPQEGNASHPKSRIVVQQNALDRQAHLESLVSNMGKGKNGHVCLYCGKLYSRKYGLKIHIRTHTGYKPLACKICHRPFGDPSNLNKHVRLHSDGNTPYSCDICGKVLVRRRDLDRHVQSRHAGLLSQTRGNCTASTNTNGTSTNNRRSQGGNKVSVVSGYR